MDFSIAVFVFGLMFAFLWEMKADIFLLVFGISVYAFFLLFIFISDPIGTYQSILSFLLSNPILAVLLLLSPLGIHFIIIFLRKRKNKNTKNEVYN